MSPQNGVAAVIGFATRMLQALAGTVAAEFQISERGKAFEVAGI
jgi:hypothetical protein